MLTLPLSVLPPPGREDGALVRLVIKNIKNGIPKTFARLSSEVSRGFGGKGLEVQFHLGSCDEHEADFILTRNQDTGEIVLLPKGGCDGDD